MAIRESILNLPIAGVGGFLSFEPLSIVGGSGVDPAGRLSERLHIEEWEIQHTFRNVELPMSGGRGSIQRRRVSDDFRFSTIVPLDTSNVRGGSVADTARRQPFYDGRMRGEPLGLYQISVRFQCGDTSFPDTLESRTISSSAADDPFNPGAYYLCEQVLLENVRIVNSARGDDVVMCVVRGLGSAPLRRYYNGTYCGAGALRLSEADLEDGG